VPSGLTILGNTTYNGNMNDNGNTTYNGNMSDMTGIADDEFACDRNEEQMPRFFIQDIVPIATDQINIQGNDARHIRDVLRMLPGETVIVCDGARVDITCVIHAFYDDHVGLLIKNREMNNTEPSFFATLFQGLPKGDKFDQIIQKCVELGVGRIAPLICQRNIVKISPNDVSKKMIRWNRIAQEAAKQCGRGKIPEVVQPIRFADAIALIESEANPIQTNQAKNIAFIPFEGERQETLRAFLESAMPQQPDPGASLSASSIAFFIGPEGGFAPEEIELAIAAGIHTVSLGRRILRTETAGPAVLAMIGYHVADY
jgi:16S rRNA (uracil1498-N3)-methyltransferase